MLDSKDIEVMKEVMQTMNDKQTNTLLDELYRVEGNLQKQIDDLKKQMQTVKFESDSINLLLKLVEDLRRRVEELEKKTA